MANNGTTMVEGQDESGIPGLPLEGMVDSSPGTLECCFVHLLVAYFEPVEFAVCPSFCNKKV